MNIKQNLTTTNYRANGNTSRIKYIVIHYTAGKSDYEGAAYDNTKYFKTENRDASAHYFVDCGDTVWQCVEDKHVAWHCGGGLQGSGGHTFYQKCTNSNSIGVEMVSYCSGGQYYIKEQTLRNTAELVKELMKKYNIPIERVIRHYDVTGKICPAPLVNESEWNRFKNMLGENKMKEFETTFKDIEHHWAKDYIEKLEMYGVVCGDGNGKFNPDKPVTRAEVAKMISNALLILGK